MKQKCTKCVVIIKSIIKSQADSGKQETGKVMSTPSLHVCTERQWCRWQLQPLISNVWMFLTQGHGQCRRLFQSFLLWTVSALKIHCFCTTELWPRHHWSSHHLLSAHLHWWMWHFHPPCCRLRCRLQKWAEMRTKPDKVQWKLLHLRVKWFSNTNLSAAGRCSSLEIYCEYGQWNNPRSQWLGGCAPRCPKHPVLCVHLQCL